MKHRWIAVVTALIVLAACRPADSGAEESIAAPSAASTTVAEPSATPTPYAIDEY